MKLNKRILCWGHWHAWGDWYWADTDDSGKSLGAVRKCRRCLAVELLG